MPQQITYELIIKLRKAINFLVEELDLQISDIARAMPANLGNLTGYLKLQPADKLPKRKTLENHYANLIAAYKKELKPFLQGEVSVRGARAVAEAADRRGKGMPLEHRTEKGLPLEQGLSREQGVPLEHRTEKGLSGEQGLPLAHYMSTLMREQAEINRKIGEMKTTLIEIETILRKMWEKGGRKRSGGRSWGD